MHKHLSLVLIVLTGCDLFSPKDVPADPALAGVRIQVTYEDPRNIALIKNPDAPVNGGWRTVAYSLLNRYENLCVIVLPRGADDDYLARLRAHEERHCHGEQHPKRARFANEFSFASEEE